MFSGGLLADAADSFLLVVDVQQRLTAAMDPSAVEALCRNINRLSQAASSLDIPVIKTEQYPQGLGATLEPINSCLPDSCTSLEKTSFSCCGADGFGGALIDSGWATTGKGLGCRDVVGIESHVCVLQTAIELLGQGLTVFVVADATLSRSPDNHANAMQRLDKAGIVVSNTESVLFEWLRDAAHPEFKTISKSLR